MYQIGIDMNNLMNGVEALVQDKDVSIVENSITITQHVDMITRLDVFLALVLDTKVEIVQGITVREVAKKIVPYI